MQLPNISEICYQVYVGGLTFNRILNYVYEKVTKTLYIYVYEHENLEFIFDLKVTGFRAIKEIMFSIYLIIKSQTRYKVLSIKKGE